MESSSIRFLHKTAVLQPSSKFKSHFNVSSAKKEFFKSNSSYNFRSCS
ncbi:hypothetical protein LEP1GSC018_1204 [Leptospira kirschneri str. 2008720114]|nr:hypothetical protein LEP1GSC018_1204 [Leptospira kirschneri str. 2008720114]